MKNFAIRVGKQLSKKHNNCKEMKMLKSEESCMTNTLKFHTFAERMRC